MYHIYNLIKYNNKSKYVYNIVYEMNVIYSLNSFSLKRKSEMSAMKC